MAAPRWIASAAVLTVGCGAAFAGPASAKTAGWGGRLIAFERAGDIRLMSDQVAGLPDAGVDVNLTNSPGVADGAPSWGLADQSDGCVLDAGGVRTWLCRTLAYERRPAGSDSDVMLATLKDATPALESATNLTAASSADDGAPAVGVQKDPQTQAITPVIAFTRGPVGQRDIWAMGLDGVATQLTSTPADDTSPDWSSQAGAVVYETAGAGGRRQLAIVDVGPAQQGFAHGAPRLVTGGSEHHGDPSWWSNPRSSEISNRVDPSRLLFASTVSGATYLDFLEQDPGLLTAGALFAPASTPAPLLRQLTGDPGGDLGPSWSPEGDAVVFESDRAQPGNRDIYRVRIDGTNLVRLTRDAAADRAPDWEPYAAGWPLDPEPYSPRPGGQTRSGKRRSSPPPPGGRPLRVTGLRVSKGGTGTRRSVTVRFLVNQRASAALVLRRGKRTVASARKSSLGPGLAAIRLSVPRKARGGSHKLRLTVTAAGARAQTFSRSVRIRTLRSRR